MVNFAPQLERMARAADGGGGGLGRYVAREVELSMLPAISKETKAMLKPCLRHLERADYGLTLEPGWIFFIAASRRHACTFALQEMLNEQELPDIGGVSPAAFWYAVSLAIDITNINTLARPLLAKMGAVERRELRQLTNQIRELRSPLVMAVICVAGSQDKRAAGGLWTMPLPANPEPRRGATRGEDGRTGGC